VFSASEATLIYTAENIIKFLALFLTHFTKGKQRDMLIETKVDSTLRNKIKK